MCSVCPVVFRVLCVFCLCVLVWCGVLVALALWVLFVLCASVLPLRAAFDVFAVVAAFAVFALVAVFVACAARALFPLFGVCLQCLIFCCV